MKIGDKVVSKSSPELGVLRVVGLEHEFVPHGIVTVASDTIEIRGDSNQDDDDFDDLKVTEPCTMCAGRDAETHITADHDEDYILKVMAADDDCRCNSFDGNCPEHGPR